MGMGRTPGRSSGRRTLFRCWRGRSDVVGGDVVHGDEPLPVNFAEEASVDALGHATTALETVLPDQHRGVGSEHVDLHVVEVQAPAPLGRAAIIVDVMVERALPAVLKLAA